MSDIRNVLSLEISCDLAEGSIEEALKIIRKVAPGAKDFLLIVTDEDAVFAGRLAEKMRISKVLVLPEWFSSRKGAWVLVFDNMAVGSTGA
jgi:hypothetical protein